MSDVTQGDPPHISVLFSGDLKRVLAVSVQNVSRWDWGRAPDRLGAWRAAKEQAEL